LKALTKAIHETLYSRQTYAKFTLGLTALALSSSVFASDARSIAMGGTEVTSGNGVNGAFSNPALLMKQQRSEDRFHFRYSGSFELQDNNEINKDAQDLQDTSDDLDKAVKEFNIAGNAKNCDESGTTLSPCVDDTGDLGRLTFKTLEELRALGSSPVDIRGQMQLGFSLPTTTIPFAVNLSALTSVSLKAHFSNQDDVLLEGLSDSLISDNSITVEDADNNGHIIYDNSTGDFNIDYSNDDLLSSVQGGAILRTQISVSLAHTFTIQGHDIDFGITPKLSQLEAADITVRANNADSSEISDQFDQNRISESKVNFDLGSLYSPPGRTDLSFGAAIHNVLKETIKTNNGYTFETTPQLITSVAYDKEWYLLTADVALNNAKTDNLESQRISLGSEVSWKFLAFRAGLSHDMAWDKNPTSLSLGLGIGAVDLGIRYNGAASAEFGVQVAFGF